MKKRYTVALLVVTNLLTYIATVGFWAPDHCRIDGNPLDCDDAIELKDGDYGIVN